jgi:hypothetical protein
VTSGQLSVKARWTAAPLSALPSVSRWRSLPDPVGRLPDAVDVLAMGLALVLAAH